MVKEKTQPDYQPHPTTSTTHKDYGTLFASLYSSRDILYNIFHVFTTLRQDYLKGLDGKFKSYKQSKAPDPLRDTHCHDDKIRPSFLPPIPHFLLFLHPPLDESTKHIRNGESF